MIWDYLLLSIFFAGFFGVIGFAVFWTGSAAPLWALLLLGFMKISIGNCG